MHDTPEGLYQKYIVSKTNGNPVDPDAKYFVLRLDGPSTHSYASRRAALVYATHISEQMPDLADDLINLVFDLGDPHGDFLRERFKSRLKP